MRAVGYSITKGFLPATDYRLLLFSYHARPLGQWVRLLVGVREAEDVRLAPVAAHELEADGQPLGREAAGDAHAGDAREVGHAGVDVREVHRERVVRLLAEAEGGRRRRGREHGVAGVEGPEEVALDERAHLLRLEVVGVVVAGGEDVGAEHDAPLDLRPEALLARAAVHLAQVLRVFRAEAVAHAV